MHKPKALEIIEKVKRGEKVLCPSCGKGHIVARGDAKTSHYFYCDNQKCKKGISIN